MNHITYYFSHSRVPLHRTTVKGKFTCMCSSHWSFSILYNFALINLTCNKKENLIFLKINILF